MVEGCCREGARPRPLHLLPPPQCPVYDLDNNVAFICMYQTMTKKAAITVQVGTHMGRQEEPGDWLSDPCSSSLAPSSLAHKTESRPTSP